MLGHLQAQAVYAPVRVPWTLISDSGVGQYMVLCIFTMKQGSQHARGLKGMAFSTSNPRLQPLGTVQGL